MNNSEIAICERLLENVEKLANHVARLEAELLEQRQAFRKLLDLYNDISDQLCNVSKSVAQNITATADNATPYGNGNAIGFKPQSITK